MKRLAALDLIAAALMMNVPADNASTVARALADREEVVALVPKPCAPYPQRSKKRRRNWKEPDNG